MTDDESGTEHVGLGTPAPVLKLPTRRPWYVAASSLTLAIALEAIWATLFLIRLLTIPGGGRIGWLEWALLILSGVLAIGYIPSVVYFIRLRSR